MEMKWNDKTNLIHFSSITNILTPLS
ncbi:hypothetical protein AERO8C_20483 [Aeromonas veronii]|uniref:Uncharacterized protein n=1 Tax=Aeromonas veronii TaxID=654 RepID=A0A653L204_AERVE|nr:hypothetical protein AERO8C_20483 [Aeromonas veronii]